MPSYYAVILDKTDGRVLIHPTGPFDTYNQAMAVHRQARLVEQPRARCEGDSQWAPLFSPAEENIERRVLVDLATIMSADPRQWEEMLLSDPALHVVFERGRQLGALEVTKRSVV